VAADPVTVGVNDSAAQSTTPAVTSDATAIGARRWRRLGAESREEVSMEEFIAKMSVEREL
jgi:hypothetical protein